MKNRRPTIADVARRAQVSVGTVSHVLNGTTNVSEGLRRRVTSAMQHLGYEQNMLAHSLRRQRAPVVGLCVPHGTSAYLGALIDTFEDIAAGRGYELMQVLSRREPDIELRRVRALMRHRIAGLILVPTVDPRRTLKLIREAGMPAVVVDRPVEDPQFDQVSFDNRAITREAVGRLMALGHRRFLFVVRSRELVISRQRLQGLEDAARDAATVLEFAESEEAYAEQLRAALRGADAPTALIVSNSAIAARTMRALRALGIACPGEVSLLAFEEPEWADLVDPPLSVIRQPTRDIARQAWELLLRRMKSEAGDAVRIELAAELELRGSVGRAPDGAQTVATGVAGEPTAPGRRKGGPVSRKR